MANPTMKLQDVARYFNISQPWLSQVIHSDAFQNALKEKQGIAFHHTVLPLRDKMVNLAHIALDKLVDTVPFEPETSTVANIADKMLDKLGFASKANQGGGSVINAQNVLIVQERRAEVEEARRLMGQAQTRVPALEVHVDGERTPITLPGESITRVGETYENGTVYAEAPQNPA